MRDTPAPREHPSCEGLEVIVTGPQSRTEVGAPAGTAATGPPVLSAALDARSTRFRMVSTSSGNDRYDAGAGAC